MEDDSNGNKQGVFFVGQGFDWLKVGLINTGPALFFFC